VISHSAKLLGPETSGSKCWRETFTQACFLSSPRQTSIKPPVSVFLFYFIREFMHVQQNQATRQFAHVYLLCMHLCMYAPYLCIYVHACAAIGKSAYTHKRARIFLHNLHKHNPLFEHLHFRQHIFMYVCIGREDKSPTQKVVRLQAQAVVALGTCTFPIVEEVSKISHCLK